MPIQDKKSEPNVDTSKVSQGDNNNPGLGFIPLVSLYDIDSYIPYILFLIILIMCLIVYKHFKYLLHLFIKLLTILTNLMNTAIKRLNRVYNKNLAITAVIKTDDDRCIEYILTNDNLLTHKEALNAIYHTLINNDRFIQFGKYKVIFVTALIDDQEFNFHHNVLITNNTSFEQYYEKVKDIINVHFDHGYQMDVVQRFKILVWNMDSLANKNIKITSSTVKNYKPGFQYNKVKLQNRGFKTSTLMCKSVSVSQTHFTPLLKNNIPITAESFATMDIETMEYNSQQIPVAISIYLSMFGPKLFLINPKIPVEEAVKILWKDVFEYLTKHFKGVIFVHNLGSFDGFFIYKYLSVFAKPEKVSTIIDDKNKFIQISYNKEIIWKDSFRIFPVSLSDLCKNFGVEGKTSKYNIDFNTLDLFNKPELLNKFIIYSIQDVISLYQALEMAQKIYLNKYNVDITTIYSTSTLSLKIYRTNFQDVNIPTLKSKEDFFIRKGYFGGGTDYYKQYITNAKYYDVNSLYPAAMSKPMPYEIIQYYPDMKNINLENFFGFCLVQVYCPENMIRPVLPYKYLDKTIYPTGHWIGVYFSEELKAIEHLGYTFTLLKGYEFSKIDLFSNYINHFFEQKKNAIGSVRFIAKMHLNQLYGYFGRKLDLIETVNIFNKDLINYFSGRIVKSIIKINDEISTLLLHSNINHDIINELNSQLYLNLKPNFKLVKTNVSIAAAVTAYARIHMLPYKLHPGTAYTDTDSAFIEGVLPNHLIGKELGMMKDELDGKIITEAYFLGIKQYGYKYIDDNNQIIEKSVFAGVPRDSLSFDDIIKLVKGEKLTRVIPIRFFKSLKHLSINIKPTKITIKMNHDKRLVNNIYLPINIININNPLDTRPKLLKFINKIKLYLRYLFNKI